MSGLVLFQGGLIVANQQRQVLEMQNKPEIAKAYERPKISEYTEEARNQNTAVIVDRLINIMAVSDKEGIEFHHAEAFNYINAKLKAFTYEEIIEAFYMLVSGELGIEVYNVFNAPLIGKVMNKFEEIRNQQLRSYFKIKDALKLKEPELTPEQKLQNEKSFLKYVFLEWAETGNLPSGGYKIYETLINKKVIEVSDEKKKKLYAKYQTKLAKEAELTATSKEQYKNLMRDIESNECSRAIILSKSEIISKYFATFITKKTKTPEESLETLLKKLGYE